MERTFSIIKPDAVKAGNIGNILGMLEAEGLKILATRMVWLTKRQAQAFYAVHNARPFFGELVEYMISGPVVVSCLEGDNAVLRYRTLMGATNPAQAEAGTIRAKYGKNIGNNAVHGSDSTENAAIEISQFFASLDLNHYSRK
jgi:nucleoside-diphosphate kinase